MSEVIDVGDKPSAVAVAGRTAWVYNLGDSTVSQIDTSTNSVRRTTPISVVPVHFGYHSGPILAANSGGSVARRHPAGRDGSTHARRDGRLVDRSSLWTPGLSQ